MGVMVTGDFIDGESLGVILRQHGEKARKHAVEFMEREAYDIAVTAIQYAPRDEGQLEKAIDFRKVAGGRDASGRFQRSVVEVYVNPQVPGSGGAESVEDYAAIVHDGLPPWGYSMNRGPGTQAKGPQAGGGYLFRALKDHQSGFMRGMQRILRTFFG